MHTLSLFATLAGLVLAGAAGADDAAAGGTAGRGHALGADLAALSPTAAAPRLHPGQDVDAAADASACPKVVCTSDEVALGR